MVVSVSPERIGRSGVARANPPGVLRIQTSLNRIRRAFGMATTYQETTDTLDEDAPMSAPADPRWSIEMGIDDDDNDYDDDFYDDDDDDDELDEDKDPFDDDEEEDLDDEDDEDDDL